MIKLFQRLCDRIKAFDQAIFDRLSRSAYVSNGKRYHVGDVAPQSLLDHKPEDGPLGAMISVDPETKIIKAIFFP